MELLRSWPNMITEIKCKKFHCIISRLNGKTVLTFNKINESIVGSRDLFGIMGHEIASFDVLELGVGITYFPGLADWTKLPHVVSRDEDDMEYNLRLSCIQRYAKHLGITNKTKRHLPEWW